tara:strand:- start:1069 stop:1947 length:879 start_codon:yes stop_codon:yes gene_type:complete
MKHINIHNNLMKESLKKINKLTPGLYIVSTPIGNLKDITFRAIETLSKSDLIVCEDTRISQKILNHYKIKAQLISNHKFNENKNVDKILSALKSSKIVSLISDAGTPTISDPGRIIINQCIDKGIKLYPIPGPSSVTTAISISGFSDKYFFYGFLPTNNNEMKKTLVFLSNIETSIVFFISSKKINKIIENLKLFLPDRNIVICRELTKFYEEIIRSPINKIKPFEKVLKGELTVVISEKKEKIKSKNLDESDKKMIKILLKKMSVKDIVSLISKNKNISKKKIYEYCLSLK